MTGRQRCDVILQLIDEVLGTGRGVDADVAARPELAPATDEARGRSGDSKGGLAEIGA